MHDGQNLLETHVPVLHYSEIGHVFSGSNPEFAFPYSNLTLLKDLPGTDLTRGGGGGGGLLGHCLASYSDVSSSSTEAQSEWLNARQL